MKKIRPLKFTVKTLSSIFLLSVLSINIHAKIELLDRVIAVVGARNVEVHARDGGH